jgi:hypothetical protein
MSRYWPIYPTAYSCGLNVKCGTPSGMLASSAKAKRCLVGKSCLPNGQLFRRARIITCRPKYFIIHCRSISLNLLRKFLCIDMACQLLGHLLVLRHQPSMLMTIAQTFRHADCRMLGGCWDENSYAAADSINAARTFAKSATDRLAIGDAGREINQDCTAAKNPPKEALRRMEKPPRLG